MVPLDETANLSLPVPDKEYVTLPLPSVVVVVVVMLVPEEAVSLRLIEELAKAMDSSITSSTLMFMVLEVELVPSFAVRVNEYEVVVS